MNLLTRDVRKSVTIGDGIALVSKATISAQPGKKFLGLI